MTFTVDQFVVANKNTVTDLQGLAAAAFAGLEKLVKVNLAATRSLLLDSSDDMLAVLTAKTQKYALAAQASLVKPLAEKTVVYVRTVNTIASETGTEFNKVAQSQVAGAQRTLASAVDDLARSAPVGSQTAVAVFQGALNTTQQVTEAMQSSMTAAVSLAQQQMAVATQVALNSVKTNTRKK